MRPSNTARELQVNHLLGRRIVRRIRRELRILQKFSFWVRGKTRYRHKVFNESLAKALGDPNCRTDISDHLGSIFYFAVDAGPKLMVELGTRGGESTRALLAAAVNTQSVLLSIDIHDCGNLDLPFRERWHFIKADDLEFARTKFSDWCLSQSLEPRVDVLFIDTSHEYEHTKAEIEIWSSHLSDNGVMLFHDTNLGKGTYARMDGSIGIAWNNQRGVIRAIEDLLSRQYDENSFFCDLTRQYLIMHYPNCNGLTVLKKIATAPAEH